MSNEIERSALSMATLIASFGDIKPVIKPERVLFMTNKWYRKAWSQAKNGDTSLTIKDRRLYWNGELIQKIAKWPAA